MWQKVRHFLGKVRHFLEKVRDFYPPLRDAKNCSPRSRELHHLSSDNVLHPATRKSIKFFIKNLMAAHGSQMARALCLRAQRSRKWLNRSKWRLRAKRVRKRLFELHVQFTIDSPSVHHGFTMSSQKSRSNHASISGTRRAGLTPRLVFLLLSPCFLRGNMV